MRIAILINDGKFLYNLRREIIQEILSQGHSVFVIVAQSDYDQKLVELGCEVTNVEIDRRGTSIRKDLKLYRNYKSHLKRIKPDCVITYAIKSNIYGNLAAKKLGIRSICNITGLGSAFYSDSLTFRIVKRLYKIALRKTSRVFVQNQDDARALLKYKIINEKQLRMLPGSGVNLERFRFEPLPPKGSPMVFNFIGRVMKEKGIEEFIAAAKEINAQKIIATFNIIGFIEEEKYEQIVRENERFGVYYLGEANDIQEYIRHSICTVLPSYHEGMSNVLLESAAMGRPLIATDVCGCKEAIHDGVNGFLVKKQDTHSLVEAIRKVLVSDYAALAEMGKASRQLAESEFDRKIVTTKIINAINCRE